MFMKMKNKLYTRAVVLLAFAVGFTQCAEEFTSPEVPTGETLLDVISASAEHDILEAALSKTGLAASLDNPNSGSFTVFAPSDTAFTLYLKGALSKPDPYTQDSALEFINSKITASSTPLNISQLAGRLNYHIVSSEIPSSEITVGNVFAAMSNQRLSLSDTGTDVVLNANRAPNAAYSSSNGSGAKVEIADLNALNGVIHSIDKVLTAVSVGSSLAAVGYTSTSTVQPINYSTVPPTINGGNTPDSDPNDYDIFAIALRKTGLCFTVFPNKSPLPDYTLFAPRDAPFQAFLATLDASVTSEAAAQTFINSLSTSSAPTLSQFTDIINYHIIAGRILSSDLSDGQTVNTLLTGKSFTVQISGSTITLVDVGANNPTVVAADILTNAGLVHGINGVMEPN
jgi:uncharacterized surface protein with fasciclin (FAS1) repeats